jgi:hypothetical protein
VDGEAALAVLGRAVDGSTGAIVVQQRTGTVAGAAVAPLLGDPAERDGWYYARVEDLAVLLRHLAPVLLERVTAAGLGDRRREVLLSTYRANVRFSIGPDGMAAPVIGGPVQAPVSAGGSGVPPDAVASLLLGPYGALGLEERLPDCNLGRQRDLMAVLFPPLTADLLTFYLPI